MAIFRFVRGFCVYLLGILLTGIVSILGWLGIVVLHISPRKIQVLPCFWGRFLSRCSGVTVKVVGVEKLEKNRPYIFAANHQSQFDIFVVQGYLDMDIRFLAKKELFDIPIFGPAMRKSGYIAVDRSHGRQAIRSLEEAARKIAEGTSVVIFPEGTRSPDGNLLPFKAGGMLLALKAGVPIVPVAISGTHEILPKGKLFPRSGKVTISVGDPIETKDYTLKQKGELARRLQENVAALKAAA